MARTPVRIKLEPSRCNRCRRCMEVCEPNALKIGPAYVYLDWRACNECMKCVDACDQGAITRLEHSRHDADGKHSKRKQPSLGAKPRFHVPRLDRHAVKAPAIAGIPPVSPAVEPETPSPAVTASPADSAAVAHVAVEAPVVHVAAPAAPIAAPKPPAPVPRHAAAPVSAPRSIPAPRRASKAAPPRPAPRKPTARRRFDAIPTTGPVIWTLTEAAAIIAVAFAALFAKDAVLGIRAIATLPDEGRILARVVVLGTFYAVQFVMLGYLAHRRGATLPGALGLSRVRATFRSWLVAAGWVALLLVTTRLAAWVWGIASRAVGFDPPTVAQGGFAQVFGAGWAGLGVSIALVVIIAPIAEEMVFRGMILGALGARWGALVGLVGSALVFALYHLTAWQIVPIFILGVACGWLTQHRGSLWPAVTLHVLYNAVPVVLAFIGNAA